MQNPVLKFLLTGGLCLILNACSLPKEEEKNVFRMNLEDGLSTLDPAYARDQRTIWMTSQLFNGLVALDSNLNVTPAIAHTWEISDDGKVYTFHLREDIYFHKHPVFGKDSTRKVTAEDVLYSLSRICNPKTASTGTWIFQKKIRGWDEFSKNPDQKLSGFEALNDSTFRITLSEVFPPFLSLLAMPYAFVVPKEAIDFYDKDFSRNPVGTGPFRFFKWKEGEVLLLHKNPLYFEKKDGQNLPYIDAVKVQFIASRLTAFISFLQGNLDFINGVTDTYKDEILTPEGNIQPAYRDKYNFSFSPQLFTYYIGIMNDSTKYRDNPSHPLLKASFRKALSAAIDREKFVKYLLNNIGYPANNGIMPLPARGFNTQKVKGNLYNPDYAKKVIQEFTQKEGKPITLTLNATPQYAFIAQFLQKEWENAGLIVKTEIKEGGALRKSVYDGSLQLWQANWIGDYPEGENYLGLLYSENFAPKGTNTTHYKNERYDALYQKAMKETADSLRWNYYAEMENIMLQDQPLIPLYYGRILRMSRKNIRGIVTNPMNELTLKYIQKSDR
ncbi:MAG: ABC transporter substrate-binding protein [Bacteroidia bacterium]|nr:ABC transporter substrate-binding protein [Bacteroidia bacterium]